MKDVLNNFTNNVKAATALCLEAGLPNALSLPHMILNTFKSLLAVGLESNYKFKELEEAMNS